MVIGDPDEDVNETLELLQQEVDRAESIVSSLLNFVRTEEPQRESVDLNGLLNDLLDDVDIPDRVKVSQEMEPDLPVISADPEQLRRIFRNLITNAAEAMPEGGELTIETEAVDSNAVRAVVNDTGGGISEENQEKIFEPLFSTKSDGVGLGLALAQMLVEAHGGRIGVESDEGQGSTFTVRLPLSD
jgi:signal transduction histidine kinase